MMFSCLIHFLLNLGDSIANLVENVNTISIEIISGRARVKHFPGATSKDLLCYVDATLQDATYDAAI